MIDMADVEARLASEVVYPDTITVPIQGSFTMQQEFYIGLLEDLYSETDPERRYYLKHLTYMVRYSPEGAPLEREALRRFRAKQGDKAVSGVSKMEAGQESHSPHGYVRREMYEQWKDRANAAERRCGELVVLCKAVLSKLRELRDRNDSTWSKVVDPEWCDLWSALQKVEKDNALTAKGSEIPGKTKAELDAMVADLNKVVDAELKVWREAHEIMQGKSSEIDTKEEK